MEQLQEIGISHLKGSKTLLKDNITPLSSTQTLYKSSFPSTRYYGSKLRLIEWLNSSLEKLSYKSALDCFGGTGTVSLLFKYLDKSVTYNDALWSNQFIAKSILSAHSNEYNVNVITNFFDQINPKEGLISKTFTGFYFTEIENNWLDGAISAISSVTNPQLQSDLMYCLFQASLQKRPFNLFHRKNLYIRENCTRETNFGNWRTWERSFVELTARAAIELMKAKQIQSGSVTIMPPMDASNLVSGHDLVYIDPPYLRDSGNDLDYQDRYHFLEGLARYQDWPQLIDYTKKTRGLFDRKEIHEWNRKSTFRDRLFDLINIHKDSIVILSYATEGYPSLHDLNNHFKSVFKDVSIVTNKLSHSLHKGKREEVLIIGA